jgi:hypothetical protein
MRKSFLSMLADDEALAMRVGLLLKRTTEYCVGTLPGIFTTSHFIWSSGSQTAGGFEASWGDLGNKLPQP